MSTLSKPDMSDGVMKWLLDMRLRQGVVDGSVWIAVESLCDENKISQVLLCIAGVPDIAQSGIMSAVVVVVVVRMNDRLNTSSAEYSKLRSQDQTPVL